MPFLQMIDIFTFARSQLCILILTFQESVGLLKNKLYAYFKIQIITNNLTTSSLESVYILKIKDH